MLGELSRNGHRVLLYDIRTEAMQAALDTIKKAYEGLAIDGLMKDKDIVDYMRNIRIASGIEEAKDVDCVCAIYVE